MFDPEYAPKVGETCPKLYEIRTVKRNGEPFANGKARTSEVGTIGWVNYNRNIPKYFGKIITPEVVKELGWTQCTGTLSKTARYQKGNDCTCCYESPEVEIAIECDSCKFKYRIRTVDLEHGQSIESILHNCE